MTDDNPRGEDPAKIRGEVLAGAPGAIEIGERREAIAEAIRMAAEGDIILLAGKGHETGQIIGAGPNQKVLPFDDALVARECCVKERITSFVLSEVEGRVGRRPVRHRSDDEEVQ